MAESDANIFPLPTLSVSPEPRKTIDSTIPIAHGKKFEREEEIRVWGTGIKESNRAQWAYDFTFPISPFTFRIVVFFIVLGRGFAQLKRRVRYPT